MTYGEHLLKEQLVTAEELTEALEIQRYQRVKIGRLLRDLGHLTQESLNRTLSDFLVVRNIDATTETISQVKTSHSNSNPLIRDWIATQRALVLFNNSSELRILSASYRDDLVEEAEAKFGVACTLVLADEDLFEHLFESSGISPSSEGSAHILVSESESDDDRFSARDPYAALFRTVIHEAKRLSVSDVHFQPTESGLDIRLRVFGEMQTWKQLTHEHRRSFTNEVKRLCNLSIATMGKAQDGRVSLDSLLLDLRVSLLPSQHGEKIVLRLLDRARKFSLSSLGFSSTTEKDLRAALRCKNGLILVSGPTGSGKTTTLYSLLSEVDRTRKNILTLEDPIEYSIAGITQVQVSKKLSFADALRAVLRQDPDVILVGEIRDEETADLCIKAAATGHLVLSTVHANSASEVVSRVLNLGVDRHFLGSVLRMTSAQRLVGKLCLKCSYTVHAASQELSDELHALYGEIAAPDSRVRNSEGCADCSSGRTGMAPVLEYAFSQSGWDFQDKALASLRLSSTLRGAAIERARKGDIDVQDIYDLG